MNDLRKAAREALEALEDVPYMSNKDDYERLERVKTALRQALVDADDTSQERVDETAKQEHEPVAWMHNFIEGNVITHIPADIGRHPERWTALYKDPTPCKTCESLAMTVMNDQTYHEKVIPKREWVGLTDEEIAQGLKESWVTEQAWQSAVWWAEAKLKEKNHG
jgi:hypothetical protein